MNIKHSNAGAPWTDDLDNSLISHRLKDASIKELCTIFGRTEGSIISRLEKLGIYNYFDNRSPECIFKDKRERIEKLLDSDVEDTEALLSSLTTLLANISRRSTEYMGLNKTAQLVDPYVVNMKKMLHLCIKDMVNNGWYKNEAEVTNFLCDRIEKGEI